MRNRLEIREERPGDEAAVEEVMRRAFGRDGEARLVERLRSGGWARVALVAVLDGHVVGQVLFSELSIVAEGASAAGTSGGVRALALAPLAVAPEFQSLSIGTKLVERGLALCREGGHTAVIVLGHPRYYPRFGFSAQLARPLESPYAGDSFMALELVPGALRGIRGRVEYPPPFADA